MKLFGVWDSLCFRSNPLGFLTLFAVSVSTHLTFAWFQSFLSLNELKHNVRVSKNMIEGPTGTIYCSISIVCNYA